jgi:hypothetical protein
MGLSHSDMSIAELEASHLVRQVRQWQRAFEVLKIYAEIGLMCRGMLYRGLIETLGSRPERQASWEKFEEDLADLPVEAMSIIPMIGDVIGKIKFFGGMAVHWIAKEKALKDKNAAVIVWQTRALEFVELYSNSMLTWVSWAGGLQKVMGDELLSTSKQLAGQVDASATGSDPSSVPGDVPGSP